MACSGRCCAVFNFPRTPDELWERGQGEDHFIADMLVGLTADEAEARAEQFDITPPEGYSRRDWAECQPAYTCRHWDEETMLCGAYDKRPVMCAAYPYENKCQHDCNCDETGRSCQEEAESRELESQTRGSEAVSSRSPRLAG